MKNKQWLWMLFVVSALTGALHLFASNSSLVESWYSRGFYHLLCETVARVSGAVPFSIIEWILAALALFFLANTIMWFVSWRRKTVSFIRALWSLSLRLLTITVCLYFWFLLFWGMNYYRVPLADKLQIQASDFEEKHFSIVSSWASDNIASLYSERSSEEVYEATRAALEALDAVLLENGETAPGGLVTIKHFLWNYPLDSTLTTGIISPLTLELHLSTSLYPEEIPFTAAHEAAHIKGYASETEANLLAFEACLKSGHPLARFSAFFSSYWHLSGALSRDERVTLMGKWPTGVMELIEKIRERSIKHSGMLRDISRAMYDAYLKLHSVKDGIRSYSTVGKWIVSLHYDEALSELELKKDGKQP